MKRFLILGVLLLVITSVVVINSQEGQNAREVSSNSELTKVDQLALPKTEKSARSANSTEIKQEAEATKSIADEELTVERITVDEFLSSGLAEQVQKWYSSWGAPRFDMSEQGDQQIAHEYAGYQNDVLRELAENGDRLAQYALGMNLIWQSFTGETLSPQLNWGDDLMSSPTIESNYDYELLEQGRQWLLIAAAQGYIYAYTDIAFSYQYQKDAETLAGRESTVEELDVLNYAYGTIPQQIIPEIDSFFFQGPKLDEEGLIKAKLKTKEFIDDLNKRRAEFGLGDYKAPQKSDYFQEFEICQ